MKRLSRFRPSPAMIVALTALFVALGGSAYALTITGASIKNGTVRGIDVKNGSLTGRDVKRDGIDGLSVKEARLGPVPAADALSHSAVVTSLGGLVRGRGVSSTARVGTPAGRYQVIFDRDVRGCVYTATVGDTSAAGPPSGQATVTSLPASVNGVFVRTFDGDGTAANRPFHLVVSC